MAILSESPVVSVRTLLVKKKLEHIYHKLGVETRSTAASICQSLFPDLCGPRFSGTKNDFSPDKVTPRAKSHFILREVEKFL